MKTTIELDEEKVEKIMRLTGIGTMKEAVDWALTEALRIAEINRIAETPWDAAFLKDAVVPGYDVIEMRREPVTYRSRKAKTSTRTKK
jgi:Arc/MetJ family transcription regulator